MSETIQEEKKRSTSESGPIVTPPLFCSLLQAPRLCCCALGRQNGFTLGRDHLTFCDLHGENLSWASFVHRLSPPTLPPALGQENPVTLPVSACGSGALPFCANFVVTYSPPNYDSCAVGGGVGVGGVSIFNSILATVFMIQLFSYPWWLHNSRRALRLQPYHHPPTRVFTQVATHRRGSSGLLLVKVSWCAKSFIDSLTYFCLDCCSSHTNISGCRSIFINP